MSALYNTAKAINKSINGADELIEFDPFLIVVLIEIITEIIENLDACESDNHLARIRTVQKRRPMVAMWRFNRIIRHHLGDGDTLLRTSVKEALLALDETQVKKCLGEVL